MLKNIITTLLLIGIQNAYSQSISNDFGRSNTKEELITTKDIRNRFELHGKIFVSDGNGRLLYQGNEVRMWKFGATGDLSSNWSFQSPGIKEIALKHTWTLSDEGILMAHIQQFESMKRKNNSREVETGKLIREEKIEIKDFTPINWLAYSDSKRRVIVRLTPDLGDKTDFIQIDTLPMTLNKPVVFDSKGRFWAQSRDLEGRYLAMKTHLGQFAISFIPFKGAKEIGFVKGNEITINSGKDFNLFIKSETPILTTTKPAKIYGFVNEEKKSDRVNSVYSSASSGEKEFLEHID